jgi:uncharacterized protein (TIGR02996 family)
MTDLERARLLWNQTRSIHAARAVDQLSPRADSPMPEGRSAAAATAWTARRNQNNPDDVWDLANGVIKGTWRHAIERLQLLDPTDPRVVLAALGWLEKMPYRSGVGSPRFWSAVSRVLTANGPVDWTQWDRVHVSVISQGTNFALKHGSAIRRMQQHMEPASRPLTETDTAWLHGIVTPEEATPSQTPSVAELLQLIGNAPDDHGPRQILADVLQEQGDPRGTFIARQLATNTRINSSVHGGRMWVRTTDALAAPKQAKLLEENTWLDPWVNAMAGQVTWRHGFIEELTLNQKLTRMGKLVDQDCLLTVRRLKLQPTQITDNMLAGLFKALNAPVLRNLQAINSARVGYLSRIRGAHAASMRELVVEVFTNDDVKLLAQELPFWTALKKLTLTNGNGTVLGHPHPNYGLLDELLGGLHCDEFTYCPSTRPVDGTVPQDLARFTSRVPPAVRRVTVVRQGTNLYAARNAEGYFPA